MTPRKYEDKGKRGRKREPKWPMPSIYSWNRMGRWIHLIAWCFLSFKISLPHGSGSLK